MNEFSVIVLSVLLRTGLILSAGVIVMFLLFRVLRIASPTVRRGACFVVLLQGWFFVQWPVEVPVLPASATETLDRSAEENMPGQAAGDSLHPVRIPPALPSVVVGGINDLPSTAAETTASERFSFSGINLLLGVWGAGIVVFLCRAVWSYFRFLRQLPESPAVRADWAAEWESLQRQSGCTSLIPLHVTDSAGPMLCRFPLGYRLIVPAALWRELSAAQRLAILRHELAHARRGDVWKSLAVRVLAMPHWFNPLVWCAVKQFDECAEWACDDQARRATPEHVSDYARALLQLGTAAVPVSSFHPAARGRGLAFRVRRLLVSHDLEDSRMKKVSIALLVLGISLFSLTKVRLVAEEPEKTDTPPSAAEPDSVEYRVFLPEEKRGRLLLGVGVDSDAGVAGDIVLQADDRANIQYRIPASSATTSGLVGSNRPVPEGEKAAADAAASNVPRFPRQEAVIDIAYLFKQLDEFKIGREKLKAEIAASEAEREKRVAVLRDIQKQLGKLAQEGSEDQSTIVELLKKELIRKQVELEAHAKTHQDHFLRKEAELYAKVYGRIVTEVARYAREHGIKIVRRVDADNVSQGEDAMPGREKKDATTNPREILRRLNQPVVYIERDEIDITEEILERLQPKKERSDTTEN